MKSGVILSIYLQNVRKLCRFCKHEATSALRDEQDYIERITAEVFCWMDEHPDEWPVYESSPNTICVSETRAHTMQCACGEPVYDAAVRKAMEDTWAKQSSWPYSHHLGILGIWPAAFPADVERARASKAATDATHAVTSSKAFLENALRRAQASERAIADAMLARDDALRVVEEARQRITDAEAAVDAANSRVTRLDAVGFRVVMLEDAAAPS